VLSPEVDCGFSQEKMFGSNHQKRVHVSESHKMLQWCHLGMPVPGSYQQSIKNFLKGKNINQTILLLELPKK